ncbi:hypothetical protein Scep_001701 [Stephania cephalantha]|uniref:Uncharacterized protein n=1 Tax=Stephania cephalantha TaxID=152367 RepID=A0AAP0Q407_9MAGN
MKAYQLCAGLDSVIDMRIDQVYSSICTLVFDRLIAWSLPMLLNERISNLSDPLTGGFRNLI